MVKLLLTFSGRRVSRIRPSKGRQDVFRLGQAILRKDWDKSGKNDLRSAQVVGQIISWVHVDRAAVITPNCFDRIGSGDEGSR